MIGIMDLRIGNFVQAPLGEYVKVDIIGHGDNPNYIHAVCDEGFGQNGFFGIPLTPEILTACGFEKTSKYKYEKDDLKFSIYVWDTGIITAETNDCDLCQLEYLHQLQNLYFALTNKELEINL